MHPEKLLNEKKIQDIIGQEMMDERRGREMSIPINNEAEAIE